MNTAFRGAVRIGIPKTRNESSAKGVRPLLKFWEERGMRNVWLANYTKLLVAATFLLVIAGGLVTSTKSGLSVPDWPLSYGKLMPPMVGGIRYEHTHRMIASLVGLMTFILMLWLGFKETRNWVRWTGIAAFGAVVAQGILGGLTVIYLLPAPISILHACLAQTFFALVVSIAFFTSREWFLPSASSSEAGELKQPLLMLVALIYLQLILGATLRHTTSHFIVIPHIITAFLVLIHSIMVMIRVFRSFESEKKLVIPSIFLAVLTLLQLTLGMGAFVYVVMLAETIQPSAGKIFFVTAHQTLGAALLATSIFLLLRVYRKGSAL